jgi:2-polyprenyl-3-methyl-5-hydroxy-6-metoxy-1,4-benzoquinol methylase
VTRAQPRYPGHYQPHVPGEFGYYDLRIPEVRQAQAELAAAHGISGFVYYHYWFHGKRLLERPFDEVLASGSPDFPFALCWANEEWTRNWDAQTGKVLMPQEFSEEDDRAHIRWLVTAFADDRYIKIDGRPMMLIYRTQQLPDPKRTAELWRTEAQKAGFPDIYLCFVESWGPPRGGPEAFGMDATVGFMPPHGDPVFTPVDGARGHRLVDYQTSYLADLQRPAPPWKRFPSVMVGWDNSPRRQHVATIFTGATPDAYKRWLELTVASVSKVRPEENYLFVVAWNEWAEGNHLEPDQRYGRSFLEATRAVLLEAPESVGVDHGEAPTSSSGDGSSGTAAPEYDYIYPYQHESAVANAAGLVRELLLDRRSTVVDLGAGSGIVSHPLKEAGIPYLGLEIHPVAVDLMKAEGINAQQCDLTDLDAVQSALDGVGDIGAFMLLDVIEHLTQPQQLLSTLSTWSMKHGNPLLVVSVPHVAHFDLGLRLLSGQWVPTETGLLDSTHLRFFTEETLSQMVERCGWQVVAQDNFSTVRSDQYDPDLNDSLPVEMIGALRVLSETHNPNAAVQQFVWAMRPVPVPEQPTTYLEAVGRPEGSGSESPDHLNDRSISDYLVSVGLIASESNRRIANSQPSHIYSGMTLPVWKQRALRVVYGGSRRTAFFKKVYGRIR